MSALTAMRSVYSRANRVLVLDADLLLTTVPPILPGSELRADLNARILASNWVRRFWTLQESVLAKSLHFRFKNTCFQKLHFRSAHPTAISEFEYYYNDEVSYYAKELEFSWHLSFHLFSPSIRVATVWWALSSRVTSLPEDMPLCTAILLDLDIKKLLEADKEDRVRKLWSLHTTVPTGVLNTLGPKLNHPGFKWANKYMNRGSKIQAPLTPAAVSEDGTVITKLKGLIFSLPKGFKMPEAVIPISNNGKIYFIRQNLFKENEGWKDLKLKGGMRLGLILGIEPPSSSAQLLPSISNAATTPPPSTSHISTSYDEEDEKSFSIQSACLATLVRILPSSSPSPLPSASSSIPPGTIKTTFLRVVSLITKQGMIDKYPSVP